jgi:hypothetical protein
MRKILSLLIVSCVSISVFSQETVLFPPEIASFSNNGSIDFQNQEYYFFISLVEDLQATLDIWNVPDVTPRISATTTTIVNKPISLFIVYAVNKDEINLTYNIRILNPNGTFSGEDYNGFRISNRVINRRILYTAAQLPTLTFDEEEELGKYFFFIEIYDNSVLIRVMVLEFYLEE